jgi:hypothetical protein
MMLRGEPDVTDRTNKIQCMKFWFARPSSLHDDPDELVKWGDDGLPRLFRGRAGEVITDEPLLVKLYDELIARETAGK